MHDEVIVVYIGIDRYDAVWHLNKQAQVAQVMPNLDTSLDECDSFRKAIKMYSVKDENEYFVLNPTSKDVQALEQKLVMKFITEKSKNFLLIFVVASHGMNLDGQQVVVLNEFDAVR